MAKRAKQKPGRSPGPKATRIELETAHGIEEITAQEVQDKLGRWLVGKPQTTHGTVRLNYSGPLDALLALQTTQAAYTLQTYPIPRPKAFLGHQYQTQLVQQIQHARAIVGADAYTTLSIGAAGSQSAVMQRILSVLAQETGLQADPESGDMLVRLRPAAGRESGWDALTRLSPRPTATRAWRVENVPGALNAAVAHAMVILSQPTDDDVVLNAASGSGTLAIERLRHSPAAQVIGCDIEFSMLEAAEKNTKAADLHGQIDYFPWDATDIPMRPNTFDVVLADLPFGNLVGSHRSNMQLYPALFEEIARVLKPGGKFVLITHEIKLMEGVLLMVKKWNVMQEYRVTLGLHPHIYVLERV